MTELKTQPTNSSVTASLDAIPYGNLDIRLGRLLMLDVGQIYRKLVDERRGGWCYEMNGLFAWAWSGRGICVGGMSTERVRSGSAGRR